MSAKPEKAKPTPDQHIPVMLNEILDQATATSRDLKRGLRAGFDGTFGRGGHTSELLKANSELKMIAFDQDQDAIRFGSEKFANEISSSRLHLVRANFEDMTTAASSLEEIQAAGYDFMMLDLGVSSPQLDVAARGFSFYHDGPLDMRMDDRLTLTAAKIVNEWEEQDGICNVKCSVGKGNRHGWCQFKMNFHPLHQASKWHQKNHKEHCYDNVEENVSTSHTFGCDI